METCYIHDIAYTSKECPACELQKDLDIANKEIERLEGELEDAQNSI